MRYRKLGDTGLEVSEIGFGAWGIGGNANGSVAYGPTDDADSVGALRSAFERGVNFFDTSDFYGFGHSERLIGETFKHVRDQIVVASKVGFLAADGQQDFSPSHLASSLEGTLKRLQTDYVDLYQLHDPSIETLESLGESLLTLEKFRDAGKIRAIGVSARSPQDGLTAVEHFGFDCIQMNFNLVDQRALQNGLFDICLKNRVGIIVRTPLCFGFLTGAYSPDTEFDASDHRRRWSTAQKSRWAGAPGLFLASLINQTDQTAAQFALRFCLSYDAVSTVIPGMLTSDEVEENVQSGQMGPLSAVDLSELERIYCNTEFFSNGEERTQQAT